jgi:hypothetical protein
MVKVTHRGLAPLGHPIYQRGWTLYMGPQPKRLSETPSGDTPPKNSESTMPSEKSEALENPVTAAEKTEG